MSYSSEQYLDINEKMIWEIAAGMEDPAEIAKRYGIDSELWKTLEVRPDLEMAVEKAKAELARTGQTFKNKARLMSDDLLNTIYKESLRNDTPLKDKVAALQLMTKLGELEPKTSVEAKGTGFSINISIPAIPVAAPKEAAEVIEAEEAKPVQLKIETDTTTPSV